MERSFEQISFKAFQNQEQEFRFDQGLLVFFGLHGRAVITCGKTQYELEPAGVLVVNPFELYRISTLNQAVVICLRISRALLRVSGWDDGSSCSCYSRSGQGEAAEYNRLRELYAGVFQEYFQEDRGGGAAVPGSILTLLTVLQSEYRAETDKALQTRREASMERLKRILDRIHEEWNTEISLSDIAAKEYLSVSYLSRFFQKHLDVSFTQYLTDLRLNHAMQLIGKSTDTVTRIAYECGFRNVSTFIESFKQKYGHTPGQFRQLQNEAEPVAGPRRESFEIKNYIDTLLAYASARPAAAAPHKTRSITVSCKKSRQPLGHTWQQILNIGYAHDGLLAPVQAQICQANREIGFEYLRFHGLFDRDMYIYHEDRSGVPFFDFTYMNLLFDFIISQQLKPYIELGFMPELLAREDRRIFDRPTVISGCRDLTKWIQLVQAVLRHCIERYGTARVRSWRFTMIGQSYVQLGCIEPDHYQTLYRETFKAVKEIDQQISFGGPGCFAESIRDQNGLPDFLQFAADHDCLPDFICIQCYPYQFATEDDQFMNFTISQESAPSILSKDSDYMGHTLDALDEVLLNHGAADRERIIEEANSTLWQRDLSGDTCYKAVWLAKNICANHDRVNALGYWLLTDFIQERAAHRKVFHGGYGLMTHNGIPKAGYHGLKLLARLGQEKIDAGPGWLVSKSPGAYQILFYNYSHYSSLYRYRYQRLEDASEAYSVFETGEVIRFQIHLDQLAEGRYRLKRYKIDRKNGSAFDKWLELGAPSYLGGDEQEYLKQVQPQVRAEIHNVRDRLQLETALRSLEMELIILQRIDN